MAPPYAGIFMGDLEEKLSKDYDKKPLAWWRYVGNIFTLWQHGKFLNCCHPKIKCIANSSRKDIF